MNDLTKFLVRKNIKEPITETPLPFFHVCSYETAIKYAATRRIHVAYCSDFKKDMIYLFLGRSEFKKEYNGSVNDTPICFVLNYQFIQIDDLYPFDTGAIIKGRYDPVIKVSSEDLIKMIKDKFSMGTDLRLPYQLIKIFFSDLPTYIRSEKITLTKEESVDMTGEEGVPAIDDIYEIYNGDRLNSDKRKRTIEVHTESELVLTGDNLARIFVPIKLKLNQEFQLLKRDTRAKLAVYDNVVQYMKEGYYYLVTRKSVQHSLKNVK